MSRPLKHRPAKLVAECALSHLPRAAKLMTFSIVPAELSPKTFRNPVQKTKEPVLVKCIDRIASGTAIATTVRCPLQQICEWKAMDDRRTMRKLAKAQRIVVSHGATQEVLEEVRKHFREAIAQEIAAHDEDAIGLRAELFEHGVAGDRALIEWLRVRQSQGRCGALLQQICEWKAMDDRRTMRKLAKAQGITLSDGVAQEVHKHLREAIAQEKGRLATFVFQTSRRLSELPMYHHCVTVDEVIDLATLSTYVRRHKDIPSKLREASIYLAGGALTNWQRLRALANTLGVSLQEVLKYPGARKARPSVRHFPEHMKHTMLSTECIRGVCPGAPRQVRRHHRTRRLGNRRSCRNWPACCEIRKPQTLQLYNGHSLSR